VPQVVSGLENIYVLRVPGSGREWVPDPQALVVNLHSGLESTSELGALINIARAADGHVVRVNAVYRSGLESSIIAIDTQL
jgi:hypothetical protein